MTTVDALMDKAGELFRNGDFDGAEALYTSVLSNQPRNSKALSNRCAVHMKKEHFREALADAEMCTRVDPGFAKGWSRLGAALHALKHYKEAINAYERAVAMCQDAVTKTSYTATIAELRGLVAGKRGVATEDEREQYYFNRSVDQGTSAMRDGQYDAAVRHFTKALSFEACAATDAHVLLANRSAAQLRLGLHLQALDDATECTQKNPDYARGHVRVAAARMARGELTEAAAAIAKALVLDGTNAQAKEIEKQVQDKTAEAARAAAIQQAKEKQLREDIAAAQSASKRVDDSGPAERTAEQVAAAAKHVAPTAGSRHAVSYAYCRVCSEYGHSAKECPHRVGGSRRNFT